MIFTVPMTVDGVDATIDFIVDEAAIATYLGARAMRNRTGRSTLSKNLHTGRTSLLIAEVRKASMSPSVDATAKDEDRNDYHED